MPHKYWWPSENTFYRNSEDHLQKWCQCYLLTLFVQCGSTKIDSLINSNTWIICTETEIIGTDGRLWHLWSFWLAHSYILNNPAAITWYACWATPKFSSHPPEICNASLRSRVKEAELFHLFSWNDTLRKSFLLNWNNFHRKNLFLVSPCVLLNDKEALLPVEEVTFFNGKCSSETITRYIPGLPVPVANTQYCIVDLHYLIHNRTSNHWDGWISSRNMDIWGIPRAEINDGVECRHRRIQARVSCVSFIWQ